MKISKSISMDTDQLKTLLKWMKLEGITSLSTGIYILTQRGITCTCYRKKGGGSNQQFLTVKESSIKKQNKLLAFKPIHVEN